MSCVVGASRAVVAPLRPSSADIPPIQRRIDHSIELQPRGRRVSCCRAGTRRPCSPVAVAVAVADCTIDSPRRRNPTWASRTLRSTPSLFNSLVKFVPNRDGSFDICPPLLSTVYFHACASGTPRLTASCLCLRLHYLHYSGLVAPIKRFE